MGKWEVVRQSPQERNGFPDTEVGESALLRETVLTHLSVMIPMIRQAIALTGVAVMLSVVWACAGSGEATPRPSDDSVIIAVAAANAPARNDPWGDLSPEAHAALDSGNASFRAKRYADALAQYRLTAKRAPGDPTALLGMYMVAQATKDARLGDSVIAVLRAMGMDDATHPATAK